MSGGTQSPEIFPLLKARGYHKIKQSDETDQEEDSMGFWYSICVVFNFNTWSPDFVLTLINIGNESSRRQKEIPIIWYYTLNTSITASLELHSIML